MSAWIRVARTIHSDPKVARLAVRLGVSVNEAVGVLLGILVQMPDHALDGDFREIEPVLLCRWADWRGEPDAFASAFADLFLTDGIWESWAEHNGRDLEAMQAEAERKRELRRTRRRTSGAAAADVGPPSGENRPDAAGDVGRTDETDTTDTTDGRDGPSTTPAAAAARPYVERLRDVVKADGGDYPAIAARIRASRNPDAVAQALIGEVQPVGRAGVTLAVLNQALHEMAANDAEFGVKLLRGYIRGVLAAPPPPAAGRVVGRVPRPDPNAPPDYAALLANVKPLPTEAA